MSGLTPLPPPLVMPGRSTDTPLSRLLHLLTRASSIQSWAMPEAKKNLEASGKTWKYVPSKNSDYYGKET